MALNQLGTFVFDTLSRPDGRGHAPEMLGTETSIITRPGVDGVNIRREGVKGRPFQMVSAVAVANAPSARLLMELYKESEGLAATLNWEGINYGAEFGTLYGILHVGEYQTHVLGAALSGATTRTNGVYLRAVWDLIPLAASTFTT